MLVVFTRILSTVVLEEDRLLMAFGISEYDLALRGKLRDLRGGGRIGTVAHLPCFLVGHWGGCIAARKITGAGPAGQIGVLEWWRWYCFVSVGTGHNDMTTLSIDIARERVLSVQPRQGGRGSALWFSK